MELDCLQIIVIYKKWCPLKTSHNFWYYLVLSQVKQRGNLAIALENSLG